MVNLRILARAVAVKSVTERKYPKYKIKKTENIQDTQHQRAGFKYSDAI